MRANRSQKARSFTIDQEQYIKDMLRRFDMEKETNKEPAVAIPADPNVTLCEAMSPKNNIREGSDEKQTIHEPGRFIAIRSHIHQTRH